MGKSAQFGFHTWLPDAHVEAPTAGSIILAGVLLKLGGYGFLRYSLPLFPEASEFFAPFIFTISLIAIIYMQTKRDKSVTSTKEISSKVDIPFQILSKVLQYLAKMNIIISILGPNGGYKIKDNLLDIKGDGSFRLNLKYFSYHTSLKMINNNS